MAHSKRWARTLVRELPGKQPEHLLRVRHLKSYADVAFLPLFFEWLGVGRRSHRR